jgi:7-cyano-7-deazaguanine synthase in queuosine biosynthesis
MNNTHHLLWTGGWDSTFRMLQLIIINKNIVQPYYVVDPFRWSLVQEFKAMSRIKKLFRQRYPQVSNLLMPTILFDKTDIREDRQIADSFFGLRNKLGGQYEWLAMWAKQTGIKDLELAIEQTDSRAGCLPVVRSFLKKTENGHVVDDEHAGTPEHDLFRYFLFAVTDVSKLDMLRIARENGFADILELSWFCHRPKVSSLPCGTCNPCKSTKHKGLGYRLGVYGNIAYFLNNFSDVRRYVNKDSSLYPVLKNVLAFVKNRPS